MNGRRTAEGRTALTLASGDLEAVFLPGAGMVACSLRHRGEELLGQRGGVEGYVEARKTMGIPLLYPWANRLGASRFAVDGREVTFDGLQPPLRTDANGLPMHGYVAGVPWQVERHERAVVTARLDPGRDEALWRAFPFAHEVELTATLADARLTVVVEVRPTGDEAVPVAFGFHPYIALPGADRRDWEVHIPVHERLVLDERRLPTGAREAVEVAGGSLGDRTFDDAYAAPPDGAPFVVAGGGREVALAFLEGYPFAQVFAPPEDPVIAFEPMTAPANALVTGGPDLPHAAPGAPYRASFAITVTESPRTPPAAR
jgi:galactose mutarotase-like enzyme